MFKKARKFKKLRNKLEKNWLILGLHYLKPPFERNREKKCFWNVWNVFLQVEKKRLLVRTPSFKLKIKNNTKKKKYEQLTICSLLLSTSRRQIPQIKQFHEIFASFFSDLWKKVRSLLWKVFKKGKNEFLIEQMALYGENQTLWKKTQEKKMYNTSPSIVWKFLNRRNIPHLKKEKKYWNFFFWN